MNIAIFALRAGWEVLFVTSHRRKDLVVTKLARLALLVSLRRRQPIFSLLSRYFFMMLSKIP